MVVPSLAQHIHADADSVDFDQSPAPPLIPASPLCIPLQLRDSPTDHSSKPSLARSPHTTAAPLFTGLLEASSAPDYPGQAQVQVQVRAPHTAAAPLWHGYLTAESSAPECAQEPILDEKEETTLYSAFSSDDTTMQGQAYLPTDKNQEQPFHATPVPPSQLTYDTETDQPHPPWNQERGSTVAIPETNNGLHSRGSALEHSHAPVKRGSILLPPGSNKWKMVWSCSVILMILGVVVLGVFFGLNKARSDVHPDKGSTPHGPKPTATNTLGRGSTQRSTSLSSIPSFNPVRTPANTQG